MLLTAPEGRRNVEGYKPTPARHTRKGNMRDITRTFWLWYVGGVGCLQLVG